MLLCCLDEDMRDAADRCFDEINKGFERIAKLLKVASTREA